jgi:hypothetical protein
VDRAGLMAGQRSTMIGPQPETRQYKREKKLMLSLSREITHEFYTRKT